MFEILIWSVIGCGVGVFVGLLPGVSSSTAMILCYPLLYTIDPHNTLAFYIGMITCTQYFGGASATLLGIPTETSCLPSMTEGYALTQRGLANTALSAGAYSSFIGSMIAVLFCFSLFWLGNNYSLLYNFKLQLLLLCVTIIVTVASSKNLFVASLLLIFGYILGSVGISPYTRSEFLTFNNPYLYNGIPSTVVLICLYCLPLLLFLPKQSPHFNFALPKLQVVMPLPSIVRGSVIGFICGFIPMLTVIVSSNLSYAIEKFFQRKNYTIGNIKCLSASDAGHNSGLIASLIPLFCFAIPIVPSEYILYDITTQRGLTYNYSWLVNNFYWMIIVILLVNIIGFCISYPAATSITKLFYDKFNILKYFGIFILISSIFIMGINEHKLGFYLICSIVLLPIGFLLKKFDTMPLVLGFLISTQFDTALRIVYSLMKG